MTPNSEKKKRSAMTTVLIGCGIGCGAIAVVALIGTVIGSVWAFKPGQQVAAASIVSSNSVGSIHIDDLSKDAGVRSLLLAAMGRWDEFNRRRQAEALPENMQWMTRMQGKPNPAGMGFMIPREIVVAIEEGDGEPMISAAINFRAMVRPFRWMILKAAGQDGDRLEVYRDYEIVGDDEFVMAFAASTLLIGDRPESLRLAIDRLTDGDGTPTTALEAPQPPNPETEWDLRGGLHNRQHSVEALMEWLLPVDGPLPAGAESLRFGLDWETADRGLLRAELRCDDPQAAADWLPVIEQQLGDWSAKVAEDGLVVASSHQSTGSALVFDVELSGMETALQSWIAKFDEFVQNDDFEYDDAEYEDSNYEEELPEDGAGPTTDEPQTVEDPAALYPKG